MVSPDLICSARVVQLRPWLGRLAPEADMDL